MPVNLFQKGETGAGKSSFINLLLGEDILPCSVLSNTNVICEIGYGEEAFALIHPRDESRSPEQILCSEEDGMQNFIDELSKKIQKTESEDSRQNVYKKAEIYLPQDILKVSVIGTIEVIVIMRTALFCKTFECFRICHNHYLVIIVQCHTI